MNRWLPQIEQVVIVGTGLLGTSVGLALKAGGYAGRVVGVARRAATAEQARAIGGIDVASTELESAVRGSQLLILAVPLGAFDAMLARIAPLAHDELVLTDVGSTKGSVLAAAHRHLAQPARFVGAHPMAGSEQKGPEAACATLFQGKPCVITPEAETDSAALELVELLWSGLGMKLLRMSADEHDAAVATVSHLPHAMAALLVQVAQQRGGWEVASTGFRDTTRLASSNPPMRADILSANRAAVLEALGVMRERIDALAALLERGDDEAVLALLEESRAARERWLQQRADAKEQ
ncbi:MAG: prephenate dehydrogenase [Phycisphaeraceae bacterium]